MKSRRTVSTKGQRRQLEILTFPPQTPTDPSLGCMAGLEDPPFSFCLRYLIPSSNSCLSSAYSCCSFQAPSSSTKAISLSRSWKVSFGGTTFPPGTTGGGKRKRGASAWKDVEGLGEELRLLQGEEDSKQQNAAKSTTRRHTAADRVVPMFSTSSRTCFQRHAAQHQAGKSRFSWQPFAFDRNALRACHHDALRHFDLSPVQPEGDHFWWFIAVLVAHLFHARLIDMESAHLDCRSSIIHSRTHCLQVRRDSPCHDSSFCRWFRHYREDIINVTID